MIFDVADSMPTRTEPIRERHTVIYGNGTYRGGYIKCICGLESTYSQDPMIPFRWLARHVCKPK